MFSKYRISWLAEARLLQNLEGGQLTDLIPYLRCGIKIMDITQISTERRNRQADFGVEDIEEPEVKIINEKGD
ncbi:MAG: hypothetical protein U5K79_05255 [Cyclobacteriaceae bacterium]|nr:hypothetical protein [Cyclobacteriaceae bacterium]